MSSPIESDDDSEYVMSEPDSNTDLSDDGDDDDEDTFVPVKRSAPMPSTDGIRQKRSLGETNLKKPGPGPAQ